MSVAASGGWSARGQAEPRQVQQLCQGEAGQGGERPRESQDGGCPSGEFLLKSSLDSILEVVLQVNFLEVFLGLNFGGCPSGEFFGGFLGITFWSLSFR